MDSIIINLKQIYDKAPEHIKRYIKTLDPGQFRNYSLPALHNFIYSTAPPDLNYKEPDLKTYTTEKLMDLSQGENEFKFTNFTNRVDAPEQEQIEITKFIKNLKGPEALKLQLLNNINLQATGIKKISQQFVNFDSIFLPRRYALLDSRNRNLSNTDYSWNLTGFSLSQQGGINTKDTVQQIIEIRCDAFRLPYFTSFYESVRMGIKEFSAQGIQICTNDKYSRQHTYHFEFRAEKKDNFWELTPKNTLKFDKPVAQCTDITLEFFANTEKIQFDSDRAICTISIGSPAVITCPQPHNLATGDLIYFNSGSLYNTQGYNIAVTSSTSFVIPVAAIVAESVTVYFASKRIQVPLSFICLER